MSLCLTHSDSLCVSLAASLRGDLDTILDLLDEEGAFEELEAGDDLGLTAMHWATLSGNQEAVRALLEANADVNATSYNFECTPLHMAALAAQSDMVLLLTANGADTSKTVHQVCSAVDAVVYCSGAVQWCIAVVYCSVVVLQCSGILQCSGVL